MSFSFSDIKKEAERELKQSGGVFNDFVLKFDDEEGNVVATATFPYPDQITLTKFEAVRGKEGATQLDILRVLLGSGKGKDEEFRTIFQHLKGAPYNTISRLVEDMFEFWNFDIDVK